MIAYLPRFSAIAFLVFSTIAILLFPGGSMFAESPGHFVMTRNFLSELGFARGYQNQVIPGIVNGLFIASLLFAAIGTAFYFLNRRNISRTATLLGLISAAGIIALAFLPADRFLWPHRYAAVVAFASLSGAFAAICASSHQALGIKIYTGFAVFYTLWLVFGPRPDASEWASIVHATLQKVAVYGFVIILFFSREDKIALARDNTK